MSRSYGSLSRRCFSQLVGSRRPVAGGSAGNEQLTAVVASILLVLFAIEGATLLNIDSLLGVHVFVGILLVPVVGLKLGSVAWRMVRYYLGHEDYVRQGPPHVAMRAIVAPLIVLSTALLLGTGIALLALGQTSPVLVGLHQASFIVWLGATSVHVLGHVLKVPRLLRTRVPGLGLRLFATAGAVVAGLALAVATIPAADRLEDSASAHIGLSDS